MQQEVWLGFHAGFENPDIKKVTDQEMSIVRSSMRLGDKDKAPEVFKQDFAKLYIRWSLNFVDDQVAIPYDYGKDF